jgi:hypothetical protein
MNQSNLASTRPTVTYRGEMKLTVKPAAAPRGQAKTYSDAGKEGIKARTK